MYNGPLIDEDPVDLYHENNEWTQEARDLEVESVALLRPLIEAWAEEGYDIRQIMEAVKDTVHMIGLEWLLDWKETDMGRSSSDKDGGLSSL